MDPPEEAMDLDIGPKREEGCVCCSVGGGFLADDFGGGGFGCRGVDLVFRTGVDRGSFRCSRSNIESPFFVVGVTEESFFALDKPFCFFGVACRLGVTFFSSADGGAFLRA